MSDQRPIFPISHEKPKTSPKKTKWNKWIHDVLLLETQQMIHTRKLLRYTFFSMICFVCVVGITFAVIIKSPSKVQLPNFTGRSIIPTLQFLQKHRLRAYVYERPSANTPHHYITSQVPHPGTIVKSGRTIVLTVSKGKQTAIMPNFVGRLYLDAKNEMNKISNAHGIPLQIMRVRQINSNDPPRSRHQPLPHSKYLLIS